jgi:hypothetical protein
MVRGQAVSPDCCSYGGRKAYLGMNSHQLRFATQYMPKSGHWHIMCGTMSVLLGCVRWYVVP